MQENFLTLNIDSLSVAELYEVLPHGSNKVVARNLGINDTMVTKTLNGKWKPKTIRGEMTYAKIIREVRSTLKKHKILIMQARE